MAQLKLFALVACLSLVTVGSASANPWGYHHRGYYYGYRPGFYGYPPVVVPPPPVVYAPPVYPVPPPAYYPPPAPIYGPPAYSYGVVGPRGVGFGYATPGFGVYIGR